MLFLCDDVINVLPRDDDNEIHDVPRISEVAALVKDEPVGQDLGDHLHREDGHEHGLELLLKY